MKGLFTALALLFLFVSCKESGVPLSKPTTFVKYYSDGQQDEAVDILETSDKGYIILSHSDSSNSIGVGWTNIIKTDFGGNTIWQKSFRGDGAKSDLVPSNFVSIKDNSGADQGYVIVGTAKNLDKFGARLFVLRLNSDGTLKDSVYYFTQKLGNSSSFRSTPRTGQYVLGRGVAQSSNSTNDIFVVGQVVGPDLVTPIPPDINGKGGDMYFAQINGTTLDTVFTKIYGAGTSVLANRLYLDFTQTSAYWGGTRTDDQGTHMRLINAVFNSQLTNFDLPYPSGESGYVGNDFSPYGYGFALVGNNLSGSEIDLVTVGSAGNELRPAIKVPSDNSNIIQITGNSVCSTLDGGLLILGTTAVDAQGTNTDYYLAKLDPTGTQTWEKIQGGKYLDAGVRVLQSSDGGYVVLGTTTLANVKTVFLMKTDSQGNIQ
jgi:hypothetical protein